MTQAFPPPPAKPFERLQANDGLLINAERWRKAHEYHRQRQNVHYQSLNQPGIVHGLGVHVIPAPAEVQAKFRDGRWVQIQPGIALDLAGNPIIVPQPIDFRIAVETPDQEPLMVYLVVSYVDPEDLRRDERREMIQETFRIDEKTSPSEGTEVEVCRVLLQPGEEKLQLSLPSDVFFPGYNNLDLRFRTQARARSQAVVRMAQVNHSDPDCARGFFNLGYLLRSVEVLYPQLEALDEVGQVTLEPENETLEPYDLLYLTGKQALSLNSREFETLKRYLDRGGGLFVDAPSDGTALVESVTALAQQLETPLEYLDRLRRDHPLRTRPFLFAALPMINKQPIRLLTGGGIVLVIGDLASAWGLDEGRSLARVTIRTAQELGINLLHYAWRRRQLISLQQHPESRG